jgi:hypothetical protein
MLDSLLPCALIERHFGCRNWWHSSNRLSVKVWFLCAFISILLHTKLYSIYFSSSSVLSRIRGKITHSCQSSTLGPLRVKTSSLLGCRDKGASGSTFGKFCVWPFQLWYSSKGTHSELPHVSITKARYVRGPDLLTNWVHSKSFITKRWARCREHPTLGWPV